MSKIIKLQYENSQNLQRTHYEKRRTGSKEVEPMTQPPLRMYEIQNSATLFLYFVRNDEFTQINLLHLFSPNLQRQQSVVLFPLSTLKNIYLKVHIRFWLLSTSYFFRLLFLPLNIGSYIFSLVQNSVLNSFCQSKL